MNFWRLKVKSTCLSMNCINLSVNGKFDEGKKRDLSS